MSLSVDAISSRWLDKVWTELRIPVEFLAFHHREGIEKEPIQ